MIRKRDFILYLLVLAFLLLATSYTAVSGKRGLLQTENTNIPAKGDVSAPGVAAQDTADQRVARIAELKEKLASGEGQVLSAPSVFTSVDTQTAPETSTDSAESENAITGERIVQYCGSAGPNRITGRWPTGATLESSPEGRTVFNEQITTQASGSTTQQVIEKNDLITLPVRDVRSTFDTCLPDSTIGVALDGSLLDNSDAAQYMGAGPKTQIGYARDGFPIYGPLADSAGLDGCGGQYINFSYQYHLRSDEPNMIACYASLPADFN